MKSGLYVNLILLIASIAAAQVPCGPSIIMKATLVVNWPQFLYDPARSGCNPYESVLSVDTVGSLTTKWQYQSGANGVVSSPVVANGVLYFGSSPDPFSGGLNAIEASTGKLLWDYGLGAPGTSPAAVANGIIYVGGSLGVFALTPAGAPVWIFSTAPYQVRAAPAVVNGVVYVLAAGKTMYALNASTGAQIWSTSISNLGSDGYSAPAVADGMVYVGSPDSNLYALDAATGVVVWKYQTGGNIHSSSPSVANGKVYVGSLDGNFYALNAKTGALVWSYTIGNYQSSSASVSRGVVYFTSDGGTLYALNGSTGALVWQAAIGGSESSPAVANGVVYAVGAGDIYALNASNGAVLWTAPVADFASSPAVANGVVYIDDYNALTAFHLPGR
jgi:outer membrane protein assembly factor BamB